MMAISEGVRGLRVMRNSFTLALALSILGLLHACSGQAPTAALDLDPIGR